jgi:hypothetical protein
MCKYIKKAAYVASVQQSRHEILTSRTWSRLYGPAIWMVFATACIACGSRPLDAAPTDLSPEAYVALHGGTLVPAGQLEIDGKVMACGRYPTVLDSQLSDFGASLSGFVILNPRLFGGLATPVKLWIYSHECAHQTVGADEVKADCAAVQRGRREGWLSESGVAQICEFMRSARGDHSHFTGAQRCALMQQCFKVENKPPRDH